MIIRVPFFFPHSFFDILPLHPNPGNLIELSLLLPLYYSLNNLLCLNKFPILLFVIKRILATLKNLLTGRTRNELTSSASSLTQRFMYTRTYVLVAQNKTRALPTTGSDTNARANQN